MDLRQFFSGWLQISQIKLILSVLPHRGELLRWYEASSRSREQCCCTHIPLSVASPQRCFARSFPSCWKEIQNHVAAGHESARALQAAQEQWMQDRAETKTGCLPSVTVLSQRHSNCWCLMSCAAPEQQETAVSVQKQYSQSGKVLQPGWLFKMLWNLL